MFVITRRFGSMRSVAEAARRAEEGLAPILRQTPGFQGYHIIDGGDGIGLSITMFDTREQALKVRDEAMAWIEKNLADLYEGKPEVTMGEVIVSVRPTPEMAEAEPHQD